MSTVRRKRRPMSEINVVPYIDVMLVLMVIFMITAPLLTQGVKIDLPQANSEPLSKDAKEPIVVFVDAEGKTYLDIGDKLDKPVDAQTLVNRVAAVLRHKPGTPIMIKGDRNARYEAVVSTMTRLQAAGAPSIGLVTETPERPRKR